MMKLTIVASGSAANCMVVSIGDTNIMVDAGLTYREAFPRLMAAGIELESIAAVLITHEHGDHIGALSQIAGRLRIPIYLTNGTLYKAKAEHFPRNPKIFTFDHDSVFRIRNVMVEAFPVPHDAEAPVGYRLTGAGTCFAMATDLGKITPTVEKALLGADIVFLESNHDEAMLAAGPYPLALQERVRGTLGHLSNDAVGEFLRRGLQGTSRVVLGHVSLGNNLFELARLSALDALDGRAELQIAATDGGFME